MFIHLETKKETIENKVRDVFTVINDNQFEVYKITGEHGALFQIKFINKMITLNDLLILGLAPYSPTLTPYNNELLITISVDKI